MTVVLECLWSRSCLAKDQSWKIILTPKDMGIELMLLAPHRKNLLILWPKLLENCCCCSCCYSWWWWWWYYCSDMIWWYCKSLPVPAWTVPLLTSLCCGPLTFLYIDRPYCILYWVLDCVWQTSSVIQCVHASTKFTEAVNNNTDGISKHRLSPYNAHCLNYNFSLGFCLQYLMNMRFKIIQSCAV